MDPKLLCAILLLTTILIIYLAILRCEGFATKREKAATIYDWFARTSSPNYIGYKEALKDDANIVEYNDVLNLFKKKDLTLGNVESVI